MSSCCWGTVGSAFKTLIMANFFFQVTLTTRLQVAGIMMLGDTSREMNSSYRNGRVSLLLFHWLCVSAYFSLSNSQKSTVMVPFGSGLLCIHVFLSIKNARHLKFHQQCDDANSSNCALAFQTPSIAVHREILTCFLHRKMFSGQIWKKHSRSPRGQWQRNKPFE